MMEWLVDVLPYPLKGWGFLGFATQPALLLRTKSVAQERQVYVFQ